MHVLVAADSFPPATAAEVARALASGWATGAPHDAVTATGLSAGGRGFSALVAEALRRPAPADGVLLVDGGGGGGGGARTAYVDAAATNDGSPGSRGLGTVLLRALDAGATRVVVGLDAGCVPGQVPDGGAGLLLALAAGQGSAQARALGAGLELRGGAGREGAAREGTSWATEAVEAVTTILGAPADVWRDVARAARSGLGGIDLVGAVASDIPLLGLHGTSACAARDHLVDDDAAQRVERALGHYAHAVWADLPAGRRLLPLAGERQAQPSARSLTGAAGAGSGGGAGFAIAALGGRLLPGAGVFASVVGLGAAAAAADLVVTGRAELDGASFDRSAVGEVARAAGAEGVPCLVVAGSSLMSRRESSTHGITALHVLDDDPTAPPRPGGRGAEALLEELAARAARLARSWSPSRLAGSR